VKRSIILCLGLASILSAVSAQHSAPSAPGGKKRITIEHVLGGRSPIRATPVVSDFRWLADGKHFLYRPLGGRKARTSSYWVQSVSSESDRPFLERKKIEQAAAKLADPPSGFRANAFRFGRGLDRLIFRRPNGYLFYDRESGAMTRTASFDPRGKRHVTLSPDQRHVAYVIDNNLFATDLESGEENRFTDDGDADILNGVHSWVYYEELYHRNYRAFWWSPDGKHLAFFRSDDSPVFRLTLVDEVPTKFREIKQRYPKAGMENPEVRLGVINLANGGITWMKTGAEPEDLLGHVTWTPDGSRVVVQVLNRIQNRLRLVLCDPDQGTAKTIVEEANESWVPVRSDFTFLANGDVVWPSARDGYFHLYLYDASGKVKRRLTQGKWTVHRILGVDEQRNRVYFIADKGSSLERHLFAVGLDGKGLERLTREPGTHSAILSSDFEHFIDTFSSIDHPRRVLLKNRKGKVIRELGKSEVQGTDRFQLCRPEIFTYKTADGLELPGVLLKPPGYKKGQRYPLLVSIYGGPANQGVSNRWRVSTQNQAFAQMGVLVALLDHRGANHLGHAGNAQLYGNLGKWEISDYADAVRHLVKKGLVDPERVGIWGWSYGGYVTCMALLTAPEVFTVGVAVAPVTDWKNYDTIYTERYMGLPEKNRAGYRYGSASTHAANLEGKLLIMHGMLDDNVHFQNTVQLARALIRAGKQFDMMAYPQAYHGIGVNHARPHLFRKMFSYFATHLVGEQKRRL